FAPTETSTPEPEAPANGGPGGRFTGASNVPCWGLDELELRIWLWMLPSRPVPYMRTDGVTEAGAAGMSGPAAAAEASEDRGCDAVLTFLGELVVVASRRPQDGYELVRTWLPVEKCQVVGLSPLPALALRNCLRLLRSRRSGGEVERAAVCGYVAGVLHLLTQQLDDPWVMVHLLEHAVLADKTAVASVEAAGGGVDGGVFSAARETAISLPPEGRPLLFFYEWALKSSRARSSFLPAAHTAGPWTGALGSADPDSNPGQQLGQEPQPKRRRKSSAVAEIRRDDALGKDVAVLTPWRLGDLRIELTGAASLDGNDASDAPDATTAGKALSKKLRTCIKNAVKALKKNEKEASGGSRNRGDGGSTMLPADACTALADAAAFASQLFTRHCAEPAEAVAHAVKLLRLAVKKAPAATFNDNGLADSSGQATPRVCDMATAAPGLREVLLAALWTFVIAKPLASCCLGPADVLSPISKARGGAPGDGDCAGQMKKKKHQVDDEEQGDKEGEEEEEGEEGEEMLPGMAALDIVARGGASGTSPAWDSQLPAVLLLQVAFRRRRQQRGKEHALKTDFGSIDGHMEGCFGTLGAAASPTWARIAAAGSIPFWITSLLSNGGDATIAFDMVRRLLDDASAQVAAASGAVQRHVQTYSHRWAAYGTLTRVLRNSAFTALLVTETPLSSSHQRWQQQEKHFHAKHHLGHQVIQHDHPIRSAVISASRKLAVSLVVDLWNKVTATAPPVPLDQEAAFRTSTIAAATAAGTAAVRAACARHIRAAAAGLRALLMQKGYGQRRGIVDGGDADAFVAVAILLPLARCASAGQLLPLVQELLAAAATLSAAPDITVAAPLKRKSTANANGMLVVGEAAAATAAAAALRQPLLEVALALAGSLLADPRQLLGHFEVRVIGRRGAGCTGAVGGCTEGGDGREAADLIDGAGTRVREIFGMVQSELASLVKATASSAGDGSDIRQAAELAAVALRDGLLGPGGHFLALSVTEPGLEACVRLAPYSAAAADAAAAALELGPPALHVHFAAVVQEVVTAAEQQRPGVGRRLALARLLPAADAYTRLAEMENSAGASVTGDEPTPASEAVIRAFREPLFAYCTRKAKKKVTAAPAAAAAAATFGRRKSGAIDLTARTATAVPSADGGLPADAIALLRTHAVPVLTRLLRFLDGRGSGGRESADGGRQQQQQQQPDEGGKSDPSVEGRSLLHCLTKILPPPGMPFSLDEDKDDGNGDGDGGKNMNNREVRPPLASSVEQLTLAESLLRDGLGRGIGGGGPDSRDGAGGAAAALSETQMAAIGLVLGAAAATLAAQYGKGVLPSGGGSAAHRHLLAAASSCLDGCVGDLLADMSNDARGGPAFTALCRVVQPLATATAVHAAGDPAALRCLRRLLAALLPQAAGGGEGGAAADAMENPTAGDVESDVSSSSSEGSGSEGSATDGEGVVELHAGRSVGRRPGVSKAVGDDASGSESADEELGDGGESDEGKSDEEAAEDAMEEDEEAAEAGRGILSSSSRDESDSEDRSSDGDGKSNGHSRGSTSTSTSSRDESDSQGEEQEALDVGNRDSDVEMESAEEVTDGEEVMAGLGGKQDVVGGGDGSFLQLPYGVVPNAAAAMVAGAMLESFITSPALLAVFAPSTATAATAQLPPVVARLPLPLVSLLQVGDATSAGMCLLPGPQEQGVRGSASEADAGAPGGDEALRTEFATLLETLLDLRLAYDVYDPYGHRVSNGDAADNMGVGGDGGDGGASPFGHGATERTVLSALLQLLQCAYGATLRESDRAILRVLLRLDELLLLRQIESGASASDDLGTVDAVARRLSGGPLALSGYLWGAAACHFYEAVAAAEAAGTAAVSATDAADTWALRARAVVEHQPSDPRIIALACVHFPVGRTLTADEDDPWVRSSTAAPPVVVAAHGSGLGPLCGGGGSGGRCSTVASAAADPAWLLPFTVCCLREGAVTVQDLAGWGLLPLCLRCLASDDLGLRTLAYESLALASAQLDALATAAASTWQSGGAVARAGGVKVAGPAALGSFLPASEAPVGLSGEVDDGPASASAAKGPQGPLRAATDFRRRHQLQAILAHVRNAVTAPLQQFPHISALFAAEAAVVLMQPQAPMFKPVTRLVARRPSLDLTTPPLFNRVLAAGSPGQRHEQAWALQLLRWGVLGPLDASICRRKFVLEICQALFGSQAAALDRVAATTITSAAAKAAGISSIATATGGEVAGNEAAAAGPSLPLEVLLSLSRLPPLGRHLVLHAGFAPWLGHLAASVMQDEYSRLGGGGAAASPHLPLLDKPAGRTTLPAVTELALETLLDLTRRRVCLRRQDGDAAVSLYTQAVAMMATAAVSCSSGEMATRTCGLVVAMATVLPPWRARPLWRGAATPEVMLQLYGVITGVGGGGAVEGLKQHRLRTWLQAVLRSSFPRASPPASAAVAAAAAVTGIMPCGTYFPYSSPDGPATSTTTEACSGPVQGLACTAISAALALTRTVHQVRVAQQGPQAAGFHLATHGSQTASCRAAAATALACLFWLTSLVAAGHSINPEGGAAAVSEALYELVAAATLLGLASRDTAAAASRVTLLAHAVCQGALLAECQQDSMRTSNPTRRTGSGSSCGGSKGGDNRGLKEQEQRWLCVCQRLHAVMGPSSFTLVSRMAAMHGLRQHEHAVQVQDPSVTGCWQGLPVSPAIVQAWLRAARAALAEMGAETAGSDAGPAAGGEQADNEVRGLGGASTWMAVEAGLLDVLGR
ncbi:hypothetical protein Vafri_13493, partial [Volvox africanus]